MDLGIGSIIAVFAGLGLMLLFFRKTFGVLDPFNWFLASRVAPALSVLVWVVVNPRGNYFFVIIFALSVVLFVAVLFATTKRLPAAKNSISPPDIRRLGRLSIYLVLTKITLLYWATGELPIFGEGGSDAFIEFDSKNKVVSSLLLALRSSDIILLVFVIPLMKTRRRRIMYLLILILIALPVALSSGKKAALLSFFFSMGLGEYMRIHYIERQSAFFIRPIIVGPLTALVFGWASWIYFRTVGGDFSQIDISTLAVAVEFVYYQFAYPHDLFTSGVLADFFANYNPDKLRYFFHTALKPLGFPAFDASIGPSIQDHLGGGLTGRGINPTFIIEGYVLTGVGLPFYAMAAGAIVGFMRNILTRIKNIRNRVLCGALLLQSVHIVAIDALFFMKIVMGLILMAPILVFLSRIRLFGK